jgi:hypothetical protein
MMYKIFNQTFLLLIPMLVASLLLMSCSASEHASVSYKHRPPLTETNETTWFSYWEDQLDANRGRVISPPMEYPPVAHSAYERAVQDWNMKANEAQTKTYIAWTAAGIGATVLLYVLVVSSNTP